MNLTVDESIKMLKSMKYDDDIECSENMALDMAIKALEQQPQWHKAEDDLPEYAVLCVNKYNEYMIGYIFKSEESDTGYAVESDNELMYDVIAWMELPERKENKNDNEKQNL